MNTKIHEGNVLIRSFSNELAKIAKIVDQTLLDQFDTPNHYLDQSGNWDKETWTDKADWHKNWEKSG